MTDVKKMTIWGNHSTTQYPDLFHCEVGGRNAYEAVGDHDWVDQTFIPTVAKRGAAIIEARGASSAASAANAAVDHIRSWALGTADGDWVSMAIPSDGSYGVPEGIISSFPCVCRDGNYEIVQGLEIDDYSRAKIDATADELVSERDAVKELGLDLATFSRRGSRGGTARTGRRCRRRSGSTPRTRRSCSCSSIRTYNWSCASLATTSSCNVRQRLISAGQLTFVRGHRHVEHVGEVRLQRRHRLRVLGVGEVMRHADAQRHRRHPGPAELGEQHARHSRHALVGRLADAEPPRQFGVGRARRHQRDPRVWHRLRR